METTADGIVPAEEAREDVFALDRPDAGEAEREGSVAAGEARIGEAAAPVAAAAIFAGPGACIAAAWRIASGEITDGRAPGFTGRAIFLA